MSSKLNKYISILAIGSLIMAHSALVYADETEVQIDKNTQFLDGVKRDLELSKTDYRQLLNNITDTKQRLDLVSEEKTSLQEQLINIDERVSSLTSQLDSVRKNVIYKENEITLLYGEIDANQVAMDYQKKQLSDYVKTIYQEDNALFSRGDDGSIDAFKLLLTDGTVGENMRQVDYFKVLDVAGSQMVDRLNELGENLNLAKKDLEKKRIKLAALQDQIAKQKKELEIEQQSKADLLKITMGQEEVFKKLLEQTIKQQDEMVQDIKNLANALEFLQDKMILEGTKFDIDKYRSVLDFKTQALYDFQLSSLGKVAGQFDWPVSPERGLSAYFHDPRYVGVFGVAHNAIDIPEFQGTPVRAAGDGVVYVARDNGYGYNYIIISHGGGLMTVYGHVSSIFVTAGQKIDQGSIIGLSGGMPGTPGAGYMTTGPHLHFEVHLNGKTVDPLYYLPLQVLTQEQVAIMPDEYQTMWREQMIKALGEVAPVER